MAYGFRSCLVALSLADRLGLGAADCQVAYHLALLRRVGTWSQRQSMFTR